MLHELNVDRVGLGILREKIAEINKRAAKIGAELLRLEEGELKQVKDRDGNVVALSIPVVISGEFPVIAGWRMIGTINHKEGGLLFGNVPEQYRKRSFCDHCNTQRRRNKTVILVHDNGEMMQVGTTCLADFLGDERAVTYAIFLAQCWEDLLNRMSEFDPYSGGYSSREWIMDLKQFLRKIVTITKKYGWMSKSAAKTSYNHDGVSKLATIERFWQAEEIINDVSGWREYDDILITPDDDAMIDKAVAWASDLPKSERDGSEYLYNINLIAKFGAVSVVTASMAASIPAAYEKANGKVTEFKKSSHVGKEGEKIDLTIEVAETKVIDSYYGPSKMIKMVDSEGNLIVWFSNSIAAMSMTVGERFEVTAEVKAHETFRGTAQTVVKRLKPTKML